MAVITDRYLFEEMMRRLSKMSADERRGVMRIMNAVAVVEDEREQPRLPLMSDAEMSAGEIEARELISEQSQAMEAAR